MKRRVHYVYIIFFALLFLVLTYYAGNSNQNDVVQVSVNIKSGEMKELTAAINQDDYIIQTKEKSDEYSDILIYYPLTKYDKVNNEINNFINSSIEEFKTQVDPKIFEQTKAKMFLDINFNVYTYLDYVSYVFHTNVFTGGAHPNTYIRTINYDKKSEKIITIDDLIKLNRNLIYKLSEYSYNDLLKNKAIMDIGAYDMLKEGTLPKKENFKNFAFTSNGILIFFEKYQVAPYVAGEFTVSAPYQNIGLKI